ncbi:gamma-glutamyltransferase [Martelella endophytica]|uniref:Glutathione hydrolase proenzyme n=1 Tax=Martelella endophytica TaxID=1486262 RepID=A0A0D5LMS3_MAREN|nr:gamma-glutamyltransferase [Martelella endophytica]AJY45499.1 gamma-glutamyltransferase [Martelella endophytica]
MSRFLAASALFALIAVSATAQDAADSVAPEAGTATVFAAETPDVKAALAAKAAGEPVEAGQWMVAAANPLAVKAGADVLAEGGSAADAMVAVQAVLGLVEAQSSGLGGGAFLVWYDAATDRLTTLDGRETAPRDATPKLFLDENGEPLQFYEAVVGGRSVGTPGTPRLMEAAYARWGKLPWAGLFDDAIALAEGGFTVSPRLAGLIAEDGDRLGRFQPTRDYFFPNGKALAAGDTLTNAAYGATLRAMAADGANAIYTGDIAADIVDTVKGAEGNPGRLSLADLAAYRVIERAPVCVTYHAYDVCGMGPPSSGALTVGQILGMVAEKDIAGLGPDNPESWRLIGDASRLAFADRGRYMADIDFVPMPLKGLVAPEYLEMRAKLLDGEKALESVAPGAPGWDHAMIEYGDGTAIELPSTTQIVIVDSDGNALSMTSTIENGFGSRLMTKSGFLLNNELTDFSFETHDADGYPIANRVEPGKRPRSSMAPTIVMKDGKPVLVIGSPGGSSIIGYVAQAVIAYLDWGMNVQEAVSMPHLLNRFGTYDVEAGTSAEDMVAPLEAMGFKVKVGDQTSGLQAIAIEDGRLYGAADPRREGIALGE